MWTEWLDLFMSVIDKHAPLKKKRIGKRLPGLITSHVAIFYNSKNSSFSNRDNSSVLWSKFMF